MKYILGSGCSGICLHVILVKYKLIVSLYILEYKLQSEEIHEYSSKSSAGSSSVHQYEVFLGILAPK